MNKRINKAMSVFLALNTSACIGMQIPTQKAIDFTSVDAVVSATQTDSISDTSTSMTQRYLYSLAGGVIFANPIDSETGDLIEPQYGQWYIRPPQTQDFYHFILSPDGKYFYAMDKDHEKIYQYSVIDNSPYSEYGSSIPLAALTPVYTGVGFARTFISFGSDNNMYVYAGVKTDQYKVTNGLLAFVKQLTSTTAIASYGLNFSKVASVAQGNHTYAIDEAANRIVHSVDGVARASTRISFQGAISHLAIR